MLMYESRGLDPDTVHQLIELSRQWVAEDCCYGMVENEESDLQEPLVVALDGPKIVGYIFGHSYRQEKATSCIPADADCFSVDELYVLPMYRGQGIGRQLFQMLEARMKGQCRFLTLATSTKNYKAVLKLYIEELGMFFHSAFLIKSMDS